MNDQEADDGGGYGWACLEVFLILMIFVVYAGGATPATNEAHYLTRAKHFWSPEWCNRDLFLTSPEAHPVFQTTCGWLTRFFDLRTTAVLGRAIGWLMIAVGWVRLSRGFLRTRLLSVFTAAIAVVLWDRAHMAGEWIVGGFEAKVVSFGFVFFALADVVRAQWRRATILASIATAFHPLVGGWTILAMAISWLFEPERVTSQSLRERFAHLFPALAFGAAISMLGVWPALRLDSGADDLVTMLGARRIYVHWRLAHHLVPFWAVFQDKLPMWLIIRHVILIVIWLILWRSAPRIERWDRLQRFVAACVLIAIVGVAIELVTMQNWIYQTKWMRYYWYRMTDAITPIGFALAFAAWVHQRIAHGTPSTTGESELSTAEEKDSLAKGQLLLAIALVLISVSLFANVQDRRSDSRPAADQQGRLRHGTRAEQIAEHQDWLAVCRWCRDSTASEALFMTPTYFQTFKWYAGRSEVVTWKDVPQGAVGLVEWQSRRRMGRRLGLYSETRSIGPKLVTADKIEYDEALKELQAYNADFVIVQRRWGDVAWGVPPAFRNPSFEVYKIPQTSDRGTVKPAEEDSDKETAGEKAEANQP